MSKTTYDLELSGCTPTPLAHYLKGLGILRLVSEQLPESQAKGWWQNDTFWLQSTLDREALVDFFLNQYAPSPIVGPWGARSGFYNEPSEKSAREALLQIQNNDQPRLLPMKNAIGAVHEILKQLGLRQKADSEEDKLSLLRACRNLMDDELLGWLDAVYVLTSESRAFPPLLGTGGNEGSGSYMSGFAQQVVAVLIEQKWDFSLSPSLFGTTGIDLFDKQTPGHFFPDAAGGPNSDAGFSAHTSLNPWDYLLGLEGTFLFASSAVKRLEDHRDGTLSYPFCVRPVGAGYESADLSDETSGRAEMWLPLWNQPTGLRELQLLFGEGRTVVNRRKSKTGLDFARSVGTLGTDRGIKKFVRYGFHQRNGLSNFAVPLGEFSVSTKKQAAASLLEEQSLDHWLNRFRSSLSSNAPASAGRALRAVDNAIFKVCQRGNASAVQQLLIALGLAEAAIAKSPKLRNGEKGNGLSPAPLLSMDWLVHSKDDTPEFRLAAALASVWHEDVGPIRKHLEPLDLNSFHQGRLKWLEIGNSPSLVWSSGNLVRNLNAVLQRRIIEVVQLGKQKGESELLAPLQGRYPATLADINAFINQDNDEQRLENLFRGLILINWKQDIPFTVYPKQNSQESCSTEVAYHLLKLCHLSRQHQNSHVKLQPQIIARALSGDAIGATQLAVRRLRNSGIPPAINQVHCSQERIRRLAAALMFPISEQSEQQLFEAVFARHLRKTEST